MKLHLGVTDILRKRRNVTAEGFDLVLQGLLLILLSWIVRSR